MQTIPQVLVPVWRVIQIFQITTGLRLGLSGFIIGPYIYESFRKVCSDEDALFYTALLWAISFGLIALLEIPTGALGDTVGRVRVVLLSLFLQAVYGFLLTLLFFLNDFAMILIVGLLARLVAACFYALLSGSFSAWIVDSIREREPNFGYERLLGKGLSLRFCFSFIGGFLGITTYLYGVPYIAFLGITLFTLGCLSYCMTTMRETRSLTFLTLKQTTWPILRKQLITTIKIGVKTCQRVPIIGWFIILEAAYCLVLNIVEYLWPIALGAQFGIAKWSLHWYIMATLMSLLPAAFSYFLARKGDFAHQRNNKKTSNIVLRQWLIGSMFLAAIPVIFLGAVNASGIKSFPLFAFAVIAVFSALGIMQPVLETLISNYMPHSNAQERATILSIGSFLRGILVLLLLVPSRGTSDAMSPVGWILPASLLLTVTFVAYWRIRKHEQHHVPILIPKPQEVVL
ncbi:MAG: hypothetical protein A3I05_02430 [Deltaproteobacteria bacterium RIFCSPLOWO2_02_FULL_44_10]|nr:MAG: hypothetical protein A3I05_02430 [Deltaproteobacteria bacterium RIFCSPLOWO2_02_FULL_44_10]